MNDILSTIIAIITGIIMPLGIIYITYILKQNKDKLDKHNDLILKINDIENEMIINSKELKIYIKKQDEINEKLSATINYILSPDEEKIFAKKDLRKIVVR